MSMKTLERRLSKQLAATDAKQDQDVLRVLRAALPVCSGYAGEQTAAVYAVEFVIGQTIKALEQS